MWSYLLIGTLIDILSVIGVALNLEEAYLGLTILAIGNALPDALTTIALIKAGAGTMAISGGYAGQLFGYLIGFGISMLKTTLITGKAQKFDLFNMASIHDNLLVMIVLGFSLVTLVFTFVFGIVNQFRMNKVFAVVLLVLYISFIGSSSVFAIRNALKTPVYE